MTSTSIAPAWADTRAWKLRSISAPDAQAAAVIAAYFEGKGEGVTLPVQVYTIARWLGVTIEPRDRGERSASLDSGLHLRHPTLIVRQSDARVHRRFSVAHEVGHLMLHEPGLHDYCAEDLTRPEEDEANQFAAALLMPTGAVMTAAHEWTVNPKALRVLFRVSEAAMTYRLRGLRLLP